MTTKQRWDRVGRLLQLLPGNTRNGISVYSADNYGEPGYSTDEPFIAVGDWNTDDPRVQRVFDLIEKVAELEWSDEWTTCPECGKLFRTSPDSYFWESQLYYRGCFHACRECIDPADVITWCMNDTSDAVPSWVEIPPDDWEKVGEYRNGFHTGDNDDPVKLAGMHGQGRDYVFRIAGRDQFTVMFEMYLRKEEKHDS